MRRWWVGALALLSCWASACGEAETDPPPPIDSGVDGGVLADSGAPEDLGVDLGFPDGGVGEDATVDADALPRDLGARDPNPPAQLTWEELPSGMPEGLPRWGAMMALVDDEHRAVVFGGTHYPRNQGDANDTWSYDFDTRTFSLIETSGDVPPPRYCHCATYLPSTHELLVVGGRNSRGPLAPFGATLDLSTGVWRLIEGPRPFGIIGCNVEWMPDLGRAIVFGGGSSQGNEDKTWSYDPEARTFTQLMPDHRPPGRRDGTSAYDPIGRRMLVYGGAIQVLPPYRHLADVWAFDGVDWTELPQTQAPIARRYMVGGVDPATGLWVMTGGTEEDVDYADTWFFDLERSEFLPQTTTSTPSERGFASAVFDPERGQLFLFGGLQVSALYPLADGWVLPF